MIANLKADLKWHLKRRWRAKPKVRAWRLFDLALRRLGPGDIAIDCGAHHGLYTEKLAKTGAEVYAFDPEPSVAERLRGLAARYPNIHFTPAAVGATAGRVKLYRAPSFDNNPDVLSQSSSICEDKSNIDNSQFVEVEKIDLSEFIRTLNSPVRLIKMDVEGAEVEILEKMAANGILSGVQHTFVEMHDDRIPSIVEGSARLRAMAKALPEGRLCLDWC